MAVVPQVPLRLKGKPMRKLAILLTVFLASCTTTNTKSDPTPDVNNIAGVWNGIAASTTLYYYTAMFTDTNGVITGKDSECFQASKSCVDQHSFTGTRKGANINLIGKDVDGRDGTGPDVAATGTVIGNNKMVLDLPGLSVAYTKQ
jgi:hypothetical protein